MPKCIHVKGRKKNQPNKLCQKCSEENANGDASISKEEKCPRLIWIFLDSLRNLGWSADHFYDLRTKNLVHVWNSSPWFCARGPLLSNYVWRAQSFEASWSKSPSCSLQEPSWWIPPQQPKTVAPTTELLSFEGGFVEIFKVQMQDGMHRQIWEGSGSTEEQLL